MKTYAAQLRAAAKTPIHAACEHNPNHARFLRAAIHGTGKTFAELGAAELIELNKKAAEKTEADHEHC